jgi:hypothetical protein
MIDQTRADESGNVKLIVGGSADAVECLPLVSTATRHARREFAKRLDIINAEM